ncbi:MAG: fatty acid desaturase [Planctomycetaceae bacterium]|nr:fatty acid desaturase [Planctomycetaceae bacterium]
MSTQLLESPVREKFGSESESPLESQSSDRPLTRSEERAEVLANFLPTNLTWSQIDWTVLVWMTVMHAGALAAPFFFTWTAFGTAIVLHWLTCSIGICLGYHRFLSHRSLKLVTPVRLLVNLCGVLSGEGSPLMWAATHRVHHAKSDQEGDPHSPTDGPWWSHLLWLFVKHDKEHREMLYRQYAPDLAADPVLRFFEKTYGPILFLSAVAMYAIGGWPLLLWGCCARLVFAYHSTWFVNSATHLWGYRNYETTDQSRNLWWVAILAYGEGWHNNHHAHPATARAGHKWWEFDPTWYAIKTLRALGLAYDVNDRNPSQA